MNFLLCIVACVWRGWHGANYQLLVWFFYDAQLVSWERKSNRVFPWLGFILAKFFERPEIMILAANFGMVVDRLPIGKWKIVDLLTTVVEGIVTGVARDSPLLVYLYKYSVRMEGYYTGSEEVKDLFTTKLEKRQATGFMMSPTDIWYTFAAVVTTVSIILGCPTIGIVLVLVTLMWRIPEAEERGSNIGYSLQDGKYFVNNKYYGIEITSNTIVVKNGRATVPRNALVTMRLRDEMGRLLTWAVEEGNVMIGNVQHTFSVLQGNLNAWITTMAGADYIVMLTEKRAQHVRNTLEDLKGTKVFGRREFLEKLLTKGMNRGNLRIEVGNDQLAQIVKQVLSAKARDGWNIEVMEPRAVAPKHIDEKGVIKLLADNKKSSKDTLLVAREEAQGEFATNDWKQQVRTYDCIIFKGDWSGVADAARLLNENGTIYITGNVIQKDTQWLQKAWKTMSKKKKLLTLENNWSVLHTSASNSVGQPANEVERQMNFRLLG